MNSPLRAARWAALVLVLSFGALVAHASNVHLYVQYAPGQKAAAQAAAARAGAATRHQFDDLNAIAISLPEQARAALEKNPAVAFVEEDPIREFLSQTVPYGIPMVQAPEAVAAGATGAGIKVGVIDSGVYSGHEDFQNVLLDGEPSYPGNDVRNWNRDILSHGTHVVGTIAAANNSLGVIGVTPGTVSIYMVKVFGDTGNWIYSSDLLSACRAAANHGCRIISMSLGGATSSRTEKTGLADLYNNRNILLVAAAGNDGTTKFSYPASYDSVVSVAAIDNTKLVATFSQKNSQVELAAPGVAVLSTVSYIESNSLAVAGTTYSANHIEFAARGDVTATLVYGGLATATNGAWSGKLVLVDRGTNSFNEKVQNVQASGGLGCIIANNVSGGLLATLGDGNSSTIPAISVSQADGATLQTKVGSSATLHSSVTQPANGYDYFDGTSMATPHVSGVAALIWSKYPGATNVQVRTALDNSAQDLGVAGRDSSYGYGLVQAHTALEALAAMGPGGGGAGDTNPPVITNVAATPTNPKNGSFEITWTTNEAATSDVVINGVTYPDSTLATNHKRTFRGTRGASYDGTVVSTDSSGNSASAPFPTVNL